MNRSPDSFTRPNVQEIEALLREHEALIIHFSSFKADENRPDRVFPNDLQNAIAKKDMELSCCVIGSRDDYEKHSFGDIGIILRLKTPNSLVAADPNDCGSLEEEDERGHVRRTVPMNKLRDLSLEQLTETLTKRTDHNEWVVRDYEVLGIFAHPPGRANDRIFRVQDLCEIFPGRPIFSFKDGSIYRCYPGPPTAIGHADIYRPIKSKSE